MSKFDLLRALDEINVAIANHRKEWRGMFGTSWEKEDYRRKIAERNDILHALSVA